MAIKTLSQDLINQIAAGEVVERPASVVKELVENSLDAQSSKVVIEVRNGGIDLIKVTDNGCGMNKSDAEICLNQHTTSKIEEIDDLFNIDSLGFRGEALASISSVSDFSLITKRPDSVSGLEIKKKDNNFELNEVGAPDGTSVMVTDIFYNVPARKKYLKTPVTEFNHVVDLFLNYCLAYPAVEWQLIHNEKVVYHFPGAKREQRISDVLGNEVSSSLIPVDLELNSIKVKGYIGLPQIARHNRKLQYLFINNRPVNEFIVSRQIKQAYGMLLPKDLYPVYILDLKLDKSLVDVNVHPRKMEVRFSEPRLVYKTIYQVVSRALDEHDLDMEVKHNQAKRFIPVKKVIQEKGSNPMEKKLFSVNQKQLKNDQSKSQSTFKDSVRDFKIHEELLKKKTAPESFCQTEKSRFNEGLEKNKKEELPFVDEFTVMGQVEEAYIVVYTDNEIKIYDQHAGSERVEYEKIKKQWTLGSLASQKMLVPVNIELTPAEATSVINNKKVFRRLGFEIEEFGKNSFAVSSLPQILAKHDVKELVLGIVAESSRAVYEENKISEPLDKILKMMACKSAIKFGDILSWEQMRALITDLERLDNKYTCVHGRPTFIKFSYDELEKLFKRK